MRRYWVRPEYALEHGAKRFLLFTGTVAELKRWLASWRSESLWWKR